MICNILSVEFDNIVVYSEDRKRSGYFLDSQKLRSQFEWFEEYSLQSGIYSTYNWIKKYYEQIRKCHGNTNI